VTEDELQDLARQGLAARDAGDVAGACAAFVAIADAGRATPKLWSLIATLAEHLADAATQHRALDALLAENPRDLMALLMKGDLFLKAGDDRAAIGWYNNALNHAAQAGALPDDLVRRLDQAALAAQAAAQRRNLGQNRLQQGVGGWRRALRLA
jgi:predicted negative regulator of RcsB-dependent stress response